MLCWLLSRISSIHQQAARKVCNVIPPDCTGQMCAQLSPLRPDKLPQMPQPSDSLAHISRSEMKLLHRPASRWRTDSLPLLMTFVRSVCTPAIAPLEGVSSSTYTSDAVVASSRLRELGLACTREDLRPAVNPGGPVF